jgi:MFS family permease
LSSRAGDTSSPLEKHHVRNTIGISAVEALWGVGLPVVIDSTFLQLFLDRLGASQFVIGSAPALFSLGLAVFAPLSAYLTSHLPSKRRAVMTVHFLAALPMGVFGLIVLIGGTAPSTVALFVLFYFILSLGLGVTLPVWQNFIVKIFTEERSVRAISVMMVTQICARLAGGLLIAGAVSRYAFSATGSGTIFVATFLSFFAGTFFFLLVREPVVPAPPRPAHSAATLVRAAVGCLRNRDFMLYLASGAEFFACSTLISFYAKYAVGHHAVNPALAAGIFVIFLQLGAVVSIVVFGWLNVLELKQKFVVSKVFALAALALLIAAHTPVTFLIASFAVGLSRGVYNVANMPIIKRLSRSDDATDHYAILCVFQLPLSLGLPLAAGAFLDAASPLGADSYRILFAGLAVLVVVAGFLILRLRMEPGTGTASPQGASRTATLWGPIRGRHQARRRARGVAG